VKKELKPVLNEVSKSEHPKHPNSREEARKIKSIKKEFRDITSKPKPLKLSINAR
jgi:hypothetical protein